MIKKAKKLIKEKLIGVTGSISGIISLLGSYQVCHNVCLGIVALLSLIGITLTGMPLIFLTKVAIPFWIAAFVLLLITFAIYIKKRCISNRIIMFNSGLVIAGIPFRPLQAYSTLLWIVGGILAITGISLFIKDKIQKRLVKS